MHAHSAGISSWVASPAEYGMIIILERLCISPTEGIWQEINHICNTPPSCYAPWSKKPNKQTKEQICCNFHSSLLKTLRGLWAGKEYYRSLRMAIHRETRKSACQKVKQPWINLKSTSITLAPSPLWISRAYPSSRPWLVGLPHSRLCSRRSSWLFVIYADLDCCDCKRRCV